MTTDLGALRANPSSNPKAPPYRGKIEIRDDATAKKIAEMILTGKRVKISVWSGYGDGSGKGKPDYKITLDDWTPGATQSPARVNTDAGRPPDASKAQESGKARIFDDRPVDNFDSDIPF